MLIDIPEEIEGSRVRLRSYRREDAPDYWEAVEESRQRIAAWLPWIHGFHSLDDAREYTIRTRARWMTREDLTMGIFERETGRLLGGCGLHRIDWAVRSFDVGYWLRTTAEGHGYMREAIQLLTNLAFDVLAANRVQIRMDVRNHRSRKVAEALGYVMEGTLRNSILGAENQPADQHMLSLTPEDYRRLEWAKLS